MESGSQYLILNQLFNDSFAVLLRRHLRKLLDFSVIENKLPNTQQNKTKQKRKQVVCEVFEAFSYLALSETSYLRPL